MIIHIMFWLISETASAETDLLRNAAGRPSHIKRSPQTGAHQVLLIQFWFIRELVHAVVTKNENHLTVALAFTCVQLQERLSVLHIFWAPNRTKQKSVLDTRM